MRCSCLSFTGQAPYTIYFGNVNYAGNFKQTYRWQEGLGVCGFRLGGVAQWVASERHLFFLLRTLLCSREWLGDKASSLHHQRRQPGVRSLVGNPASKVALLPWGQVLTSDLNFLCVSSWATPTVSIISKSYFPFHCVGTHFQGYFWLSAWGLLVAVMGDPMEPGIELDLLHANNIYWLLKPSPYSFTSL